MPSHLQSLALAYSYLASNRLSSYLQHHAGARASSELCVISEHLPIRVEYERGREDGIDTVVKGMGVRRLGEFDDIVYSHRGLRLPSHTTLRAHKFSVCLVPGGVRDVNYADAC